MEKPVILSTLVNPLYVQQYERYLPTAFDEGMTLLEKVNKIIVSLNQIGTLSNDVLSQWNLVMDWMLTDGLDASIDEKINAMLADGSLTTIIGNAITDLGSRMDTLTTTVTNNQTAVEAEIALNKTTTDAAVETNTTNITANTNNLSTLQTKVTNMKYYGTPEEYGAIGDGVADDTSAIQACLNANSVTVFSSKDYFITASIKLPKEHSIEGNHARLLANGLTWGGHTFGVSVPQNVILYVEAREPIYRSDQIMATAFVHDLRILGNDGHNRLGMYLGYNNQSNINQGTTVNFSVSGMDFRNISLSTLQDGLILAEVWQSVFDNVSTGDITNSAFQIIGQCVNNTFIGCFFSTGGGGVHGVFITHGIYSGEQRRSEGNTFIGGFIGYAQIGVRIDDGFFTKFSNIIIDLNTNYAVLLNGLSEDTVFDGCYMMSTGTLVVNIADSLTNCMTYFNGCNFSPAGADTNNLIVGQGQIVVINGCQLTKLITFAATARGTVVNNIWNQISTGTAQVITNGAKVNSQFNMFKLDGTDVVFS